jgi:outer membrane lipoprotein carrier protein
MKGWLVVSGSALSAVLLGASPGQAPSAADIATRIQTRYDAVRDFTADFVATHQSLILRKTTTERGDVVIKKPNRMRWSYDAPARKVFVADGTTLFSYFAEDRYGTEAPLPKDHDAPTALLFLAGRGNLLRDFTPALSASSQAGEWALDLDPRAGTADFTSLTLIVDRTTYDLRGLVTTTEDAVQTFRFSRFRANRGVPDARFAFAFPPGTEVGR